MNAGERVSGGTLSRRDAFLLERYRADEGELQPEMLRSSMARTLGEAMLSANGQGRDVALAAALAGLPPATADAVKRSLFAADIEGEEPPDPPPAASARPIPKAPEPLAPPLPEYVLRGATPQDWLLGHEWESCSAAGAWLDTYVHHARHVAPMTPELFHTSAALWLATVAVARRLKVPMAHGDIYPNLFIVWIATTTLWHKSTSLALADTLARSVFPHLLAVHNSTPEAQLDDLAGKEPLGYGAMSDLERQAWLRERDFAAQRGLLLDEMSGLLASAGRDYNAGLVESFLRFYDCAPSFTRSTKGGGRVTVRNSYLSLLGASTPAALAPFMNTSRPWDMGWWPRFALLTPEEERPEYQTAEAREAPPALRDTLARLHERLPAPAWPSPPEALSVGMKEAAFGDLERYTRAVSHDLLGPALPEQLAGIYGRLPTQVLKVATLLAALDWPEDQRVPCIWRDHLARAIVICEEWRESAHRVVGVVGQTSAEKLENRILALLAACGPEGSSVRELSRRLSSVAPQQLRETLSMLEADGEVLRHREVPSAQGGRPRERFALAIDERVP